MKRFQFTRPQGARLRNCSDVPRFFCFNSRARKGRDLIRKTSFGVLTCFNSRARKGRDILCWARAC